MGSCNNKKYQLKDITFTKKVWKSIVSWGNTDLFLTGHITREQKIVAMNGFQCFTALYTHFQKSHFLNDNIKFNFTVFVTSFFVTSLCAILRNSSAYIEVNINLS